MGQTTLPFSLDALRMWEELTEQLKLCTGGTELLHPLYLDYNSVIRKLGMSLDSQLKALIELEREGWVVVDKKVNGSIEWYVTLDTSKEKALRSMGAFEGLNTKSREWDCDMQSNPQKIECQEKKATIPSLFDLNATQKTPSINLTTQPFIDYWESKGLKKVSKLQRKGADKAINQLLLGQLLTKTGLERRFTFKEFQISVDRFTLIVFDFHYLPQSKAKVREICLKQFLHETNPLTNFQHNSMFFHYLNNEPQPKLETDLNPELTVHLMRKFNRVFRSYSPEPNFTVFEHNSFTIAANKITELLQSSMLRLPSHLIESYNTAQMAEWTVQAAKGTGFQNISPKFISSDYFIRNVLPPYLGKLQVISESERHTEQFTYLQ